MSVWLFPERAEGQSHLQYGHAFCTLTAPLSTPGSTGTLYANQAGFNHVCLCLLSAGVKGLGHHFWQC